MAPQVDVVNSVPAGSLLRFGPFEIDPKSGELRRQGTPVRLQPQPFKVLALLVSKAGHLVSREEIQKQVWTDDTFVDFDQGLNYCIRQIRAVLCDDADKPEFIETVPRRGYRFVASVEELSPPASSVARRVMLTVLPFENLSGDEAEEYFSDGLTDEMIAQLGRVNPQRLGVIARTSAMKYKHTNKSIDEIGRELGVSYVLEGSVRRSANRVRVTAQLIQVSDQTHLWAQSYDRNMGEMLSLQSELAQAIAGGIRVQLTPQEQVRLASLRPINADAYEAYLKGRYFWNRRTRESLDRSISCFRRALEIDPGYAAAYAGLADAYLTQFDYNYLPPHDAFNLANPVVQHALTLDDMLAEPHTSLGHLRLHEFKWTAAEEQFKRAIELNPGYGTAHYYYGNLLAALGRWDEAFAEAQRALGLDPMSPNTRQNQLFIFHLARHYDDALAQAREIIALDPTYLAIHYYVGLIYERLGKYEKAIAAFQKVGAKGSRGATVLAAIGYTYAIAERRDEALKVLQRLEEVSTREYVSTYDLALVSFALGEPDRAFALLSKAYDDHSSFLPFLNVDARLEGVRSDPRFEELVRRLRFPGG
jgi:TolB-like protein/Tfp pilus assembly protein PilF